MSDTGLLISHRYDDNKKMAAEIQDRILDSSISLNEGPLIENMVAQMLAASSHKLYYFSKWSRDDPEDRMEVDFLLSSNRLSRHHNIIPIEVIGLFTQTGDASLF